MVSVYPAATLNVAPPVPTPLVFKAETAFAILAYEPGMVNDPEIWLKAFCEKNSVSNRIAFT